MGTKQIFTIRQAVYADLSAYTDLLQRCYRHAYTDEGIGLTADCFSKDVFATDDTQRFLAKQIAESDTQKTWLAFEDDVLVGTVTRALLSDGEAEIKGLYVLPEYQGRGIGKKLYALALEFAGERDLVLDIYCHNTKGIQMYERWGWKLDTTRGEKGYFYRHWPEWPEGLQAKCQYMRLVRDKG